MDNEIKAKIDRISGINNVKSFFKDNNIEKFSQEELRYLCIKLAYENGSVNLDAFFNMAFNTLESKDDKKKYWISLAVSITLAIASLVVSLLKD